MTKFWLRLLEKWLLLKRKNVDSKKSDSATKMLTSFPCILIASVQSLQYILHTTTTSMRAIPETPSEAIFASGFTFQDPELPSSGGQSSQLYQSYIISIISHFKQGNHRASSVQQPFPRRTIVLLDHVLGNVLDDNIIPLKNRHLYDHFHCYPSGRPGRCSIMAHHGSHVVVVLLWWHQQQQQHHQQQ